MRKFYFTSRVVDCWNNYWSKWVVAANNIIAFKIRLDKHWQHQDIIYDFRAQIDRTGSRSKVLRVNVVLRRLFSRNLRSWQRGVPPTPVHSLRLCLRLDEYSWQGSPNHVLELSN